MTGIAAMQLSECLEVQRQSCPTHHWLEACLLPQYREAAAYRVALEIVGQRCGGAPQYEEAWARRYQGGEAHAAGFQACIEAYLGSESIGTPGRPGNQTHLEGLVAEHVWRLLITEDALGYGQPARIDGPDWSPTDSGGDGLAIYKKGDAFVFRLWESKAHTGEGTVRQVVNGACRQIDSNALRYLARFSMIGQSIKGEELGHFYGSLPEMWRNSHQGAGGGVSITTTSSQIAGCFGNLGSYWDFQGHFQRQGMAVTIADYPQFAALVRRHIWKGL